MIPAVSIIFDHFFRYRKFGRKFVPFMYAIIIDGRSNMTEVPGILKRTP